MSKTYSMKQIEKMHLRWFIFIGRMNLHFSVVHYISST